MSRPVDTHKKGEQGEHTDGCGEPHGTATPGTTTGQTEGLEHPTNQVDRRDITEAIARHCRRQADSRQENATELRTAAHEMFDREFDQAERNMREHPSAEAATELRNLLPLTATAEERTAWNTRVDQIELLTCTGRQDQTDRWM